MQLGVESQKNHSNRKLDRPEYTLLLQRGHKGWFEEWERLLNKYVPIRRIANDAVLRGEDYPP